MSILSYKYKAHKFINYAFYVVVFIVGFLLGFASDKINYNKLISQVLMIDNVQAYEFKQQKVTVNEEWIYNTLTQNLEGCDINVHNKIYVEANPTSYLIEI